MTRVRHVTDHHRQLLTQGWELACLPADAAADPSALQGLSAEWGSAIVPGTAASALRALGKWDLATQHDFDADAWWYRCHFGAEPAPKSAVFLGFDGLASVADVWLNDQHVLSSDNMHLAHTLDITSDVRSTNQLLIRFAPLARLLRERRPRPRWRTRLVQDQQLRWFRTTLLGRMAGWSPPVAPVGPWRPVWVEERRSLIVEAADIHARPDGAGGIVDARLRLTLLEPRSSIQAILVIGAEHAELSVDRSPDGCEINGHIKLAEAARWWPHTHGDQPLYAVSAVVRLDDVEVVVDCGRVGFRSLELNQDTDQGFGFRVNEVAVFCRGACWTPPDIVSLAGTRAAHEATLLAARDAGMNMLRVCGSMVYETEAFFDVCDELGIMVWQDFMFANMDYPSADDGFSASVEAEASSILHALQTRPSLALLCGNSEVEQQAAMLGLPPEAWTNPLFDALIPGICKSIRPDVAYWRSSPSGGTPPFRVDAGAAHYYGVGAYMRSIEDARRAEVRFASECLAFANMPEDPTIDLVVGDQRSALRHHPEWTARVPRDSGAAWDFEDVRDYYLGYLFNADPLQLRYADVDRYIALSRVVSGELMARVFAEWRRKGSACQGGLVWFLRDLWPGAGWGVLDSTGSPKAAYYYLKRQLAPIGVFFSDEGLNGLSVHLVNDTSTDAPFVLRVSLYRDGRTRVATASRDVLIPARGQIAVDSQELLGGFADITYAYRFGPPGHDLGVATLHPVAGAPNKLAQAFYFPLGLSARQEFDVGLQADVRGLESGACSLRLVSAQFAQAVSIAAPGFWCEDNYFHLEPSVERTLVLRPLQPGTRLVGSVRALNSHAVLRLKV